MAHEIKNAAALSMDREQGLEDKGALVRRGRAMFGSKKNGAEKGKSSDKECKWCQGDESGKTYEYRVNGQEMVLHDKCAPKMQNYLSRS